MALVPDTVISLDPMLKEQYLDKGLQDARPDFAVLMSTVPFVGGSEKAGTELKWPVLLSYEHGFTALGQDGVITALEDATVATSKQASVSPFPFMGRTQIDNVSVSRAKKGPQAFVNALDYKIQNLQDSFVLMNEQHLLYGQSGLGVVDSISGLVIDLSSANFADHVWLGSEGMRIDIYAADLVTLRGTATITSYNLENETITVNAMPVGVVANDVIFRKGFNGREGVGLHKMFTSTASTSLFGINQTTAPLWKVNQYAAGGLLSFEKVADAVAGAVGRGLANKLTLHVHPRVFATLMPDFNTLKAVGDQYKSRIFSTQSEVKKLEHGVVGITFYIDSVEVTIVSNPFIRKGFAYGIADGELMRCGSSDITYKIPGETEEKYFHRQDNTAALELRVFSDMSLFSATLNRHLCISGITLA
jgi:hypothetical protein